MTGAKGAETLNWVRLFSLLLAGLLWLSVALERPAQLKLQVPVALERLPAGLQLAFLPPAKVEVTVSGPRILLLGLSLRQGSCRLDLAGAEAGTASYSTLACGFGLDPELKVTRVFPASIRLTLAPKAPL